MQNDETMTLSQKEVADQAAEREAPKTELSPIKPERNYGIDALRILSMMMIIGLHLLRHGGLLNAVIGGSANYYIAWFIEVLCYGAVNIYGLISGYVGVRSKFKFTNLIILWLQVAFYSVLITVCFAIFKSGSVTPEQIFRSFLPLTSTLGVNWYFASYTILFFFIPAFNAAINTLPKKQMGGIVIGLLLITSCVYQIFRTGWFGTAPKDIFVLSSGYSPLWLSVLYLTGAYISKYDMFKAVPKFVSLFIYFAASALSFSAYVFGQSSKALLSYLSPTIVLASVAMLVLFKDMKFKRIAGLIKFFTPLTFGVYLIHDNTLMRNNFIAASTKYLAEKNPLITVLAMLGYILAIYVICALIDYLRLLLFKVLKLKERFIKIEKKIFED